LVVGDMFYSGSQDAEVLYTAFLGQMTYLVTVQNEKEVSFLSKGEKEVDYV